MQVFELPTNTNPEALGFSPNGRRLAVWDRGRVFCLDTATGAVHAIRDESDWIGYGVSEIGFTANGSGLVAQHYLKRGEAAVRAYDPDTGAVRHNFVAENIEASALAPGGRAAYIALRDSQYIVTVVPWNPLTDERGSPVARFKGFLRHLAVSADGMWLAGADKDVIRLWPITPGKTASRAARQLKSRRYAWLNGLAVSPDGSRVAAVGRGVEVWDAKTGECRQVETVSTSRGRQVAFHPREPMFAYTWHEGEVVFRDAAGGTELKRFAWELKEPRALAFSQDGLRCAAAGADKIVVWDVDV